MKISVVIPAFNEEKLIARTLEAVHRARQAFTRLRWESEIVVCDNNSTDRTAELARAAQARVVFEPVNQIARARNTGAAAAVGEWLVFVDADSRPSEALFADLAAHIQAGKCVGGGCTLKMETDLLAASLTLRLWNRISRICKWAAGSFVFCEVTAFRSLGGFNQELFVSEEIDFSRRLKRHARSLGRKVVILHRHPLITSPRKLHLYSPGDYLRMLFKMARQGKQAFKDRSTCHAWYDGRR